MSDSEQQTGDCYTRVAEEYREVVAALASRLQAEVGPCLRRALEQADDALVQRAEGEAAETEQGSYFSAMRALRLQRDAVAERFRTALQNRFRESFGPSATAGDGDIDGWSIMEPDQLEEEVAIDATVSRLRGRGGSALGDISKRLRCLIQDLAEDDDNPVDPSALVKAFAEGVRGVGIAIPARIIVYKLFEKELLEALPAIYEDLNRQLAAAGLQIDDAEASSAAESANEAAADGDEAANDPEGPLEELPPEGEIAGLLHQLVAAARHDSAQGGSAGSGRSAGGSTGAGTESGGQPANGRAVAGVLSALQRSVGHRRPDPIDPEQIKQLVGRGLARRQGGEAQLERSADETIDIVSMLFGVILEDERLPGAVKGLFARLQIPVLKVALMDQQFLANSSHPARRLFNALARAALGWRPSEDLDNDAVYRNIRGAVEQVVEQFSYDAQVFDAALRAFESWQQEAAGPAARAASGAGTTWHGNERVQAAREQVEEAIESRLACEPQAPDVVARLLRQAWFKVLFITAVKKGVGSDSWHSHVEVMDRLLWSMRPKADPAERQRLLDEMPALLQQIRDGLNGIMYNPAAMTEFFHELRDAHLQVLAHPASASRSEPSEARDPAERLTGAPTENVAASDESAAASDAAPVADSTVVRADFGAPNGEDAGGGRGAPVPTSDVEIVRELRNTAIGTWFEFLAADGGRSRARLQARADNGQRYLFANRRGEQTAVYGLNELARAIAAGEVAPVDEEALFDRALETVIAQLKQKAV